MRRRGEAEGKARRRRMPEEVMQDADRARNIFIFACPAGSRRFFLGRLHDFSGG